MASESDRRTVPSRAALLPRALAVAGPRALAVAALIAALLCPQAALAGSGSPARPSATPVQRPAPPARPAAAALRLGSRGAAVRSLQSSLARLSYLPAGGVDGVFGLQTWHAVVGLQGWSGLQRDGVVGPRTRAALARARRPAPWSRSTGIEIHLREQVLLLVRSGRVVRAIHVSTGAGGATPLGHFRVNRRETMSWSLQFHVWMPLAQYFDRGFAMHEFASVPAYPASHGCVRIPHSEAPAVWQFGSLGMRVWTRR